VKYDLVVTGTVGAGSLAGGTIWQSIWHDIGYNVSGNMTGTPVSAGTRVIRPVVPGCTVDSASANQTIGLGSYQSAKTFTGIGATSPSKPVSVLLHNCNGAQISINLQPTSNVVSATNGTFALTSGGATGVAIQMLNAAGTAPFPLNQAVAMGAAGPPTAVADFTVGMMARYVQTAVAVTPGAANGALQFVMSYQ
jgi:major type 1 subunit fimbrin (pilin)